MNDVQNLARVILRSDGLVHIAFYDVHSIYATAENLMQLFSDPIEFMDIGRHKEKDSTFEINRNRNALDDVLGLTLAHVNSDKQIVCDFPELFQYIFMTQSDAAGKQKRLNMEAFALETVLSDEKSYLLRYYLEFNKQIRPMPAIKKNIKLRDEVQISIVREIINSFFGEELQTAQKTPDLSARIGQVETDHVLKETQSNEKNTMISVTKYAEMVGMSPYTIRKYCNEGRFKSMIKTNAGRFLIDKNDKPIKWDLRKGKKRKDPTPKSYFTKGSSASAAEVEEYIKKQKLFSDASAHFIHTHDELTYYVSNNYHEVSWNGRHAFIIDVNPEYISETTGIRNRDLMKQGKAPVVPQRNKEEYLFHLHHVGQHDSSPLAIIPEYDHNGKGLSSVFHQANPNSDLHGYEFEALKAQFWRTYLKEYDKAGNFTSIPYLNSKHSKDKR